MSAEHQTDILDLMLIRPAHNDDVAEIRKLIFGVLDEFDLRCCHQGFDADLDDIHAHYISSGGFFDVLENDYGQIVGSVGLNSQAKGICELRKMYLSPECRGQGWGRILLQHALHQAKSRGFHRMELETSSRLTRAIALYERNGFHRIKCDNAPGRCDQRWELILH